MTQEKISDLEEHLDRVKGDVIFSLVRLVGTERLRTYLPDRVGHLLDEIQKKYGANLCAKYDGVTKRLQETLQENATLRADLAAAREQAEIRWREYFKTETGPLRSLSSALSEATGELARVRTQLEALVQQHKALFAQYQDQKQHAAELYQQHEQLRDEESLSGEALTHAARALIQAGVRSPKEKQEVEPTNQLALEIERLAEERDRARRELAAALSAPTTQANEERKSGQEK